MIFRFHQKQNLMDKKILGDKKNMKDEHAKKIIDHLDTMNCRLADIQHFIQEIAEYGILGTEVKDAVIAIAQAQSKKFDDKYKNYEKAKPGDV